MTFLPKGYEEPVTDNYMKFQAGANAFRVLSSAIVGMEFWKEETNDDGESVRRPVRKRMDEPIYPDEIGVDRNGEPERVKHFWAFAVYNRKAKAIQILQLNQKTIQKELRALDANPKWGDIKEYDVVVTKVGEKLKTKYVVQADPKEPIEEDIVKEYEAMNINLEALFDGKDPFAVQEDVEEDVKKKPKAEEKAKIDPETGEEEINIEDIPF